MTSASRVTSTRYRGTVITNPSSVALLISISREFKILRSVSFGIFLPITRVISSNFKNGDKLIFLGNLIGYNNQSKEIITDQILGNKPKKTRGLKQIKKKQDSKSKDLNVQSDRAAALIEQSRKRAMQPVVAKNDTTKQTTKPVVTKRRRNTKTSYQPAARAKRLNRSRHMEYKYEMRKLLVDINVPEEHRSNLLGTIWAKGERKTTTDAKDFLLEKMTEGAIDEDQKSRLEKVIDDYTIRR